MTYSSGYKVTLFNDIPGSLQYSADYRKNSLPHHIMAALMKILFLHYLIFTFHLTLNSGSVCLASSALVSDIPESSDSASNKGQNISTIYDNFHEVFLNARVITMYASGTSLLTRISRQFPHLGEVCPTVGWV